MCECEYDENTANYLAETARRHPSLYILRFRDKTETYATLDLRGSPLSSDFAERCMRCTKSTLNINSTGITEFPADVFACSSINAVWASNNNLTTLPRPSPSCSITALNISHNKFEQLPSVIAHIKTLETLYCYDNKLTTLPPFLGAMPKLKTLNARNNPLAGDVARLAETDYPWSENGPVLRYLQELNKKAVPVRKVQVITFGHQMVGKSTVLLALQSKLKLIGETKVPADLDRTTEVVFSSKQDKQFEWSFRDLPGQTEYYATNARFLTADLAVLLLVIDITKERSARISCCSGLFCLFLLSLCSFDL